MSFDHRGYRIDIDSTGHFTSDLKDVKIREKSLDEARAAIDKEIKISASAKKVDLPVVYIMAKDRDWLDRLKHPCKLESNTIVGLNRTSGTLNFGTPIPKGMIVKPNSVLPDTPDNRYLLLQYIEAEREYKDLSETLSEVSLKNQGGRIEASAYSGALSELEKQYQRGLKTSGKESK